MACHGMDNDDDDDDKHGGEEEEESVSQARVSHTRELVGVASPGFGHVRQGARVCRPGRILVPGHVMGF